MSYSEPIRASSRIRSKVESTSSVSYDKSASPLSDREEIGLSCPNSSTSIITASYNITPTLMDVHPTVLRYLGGLQPPAIPPWRDAGHCTDWVPKWWDDDQSEQCKACAIDKKSENEWDFLEAPWLDKHKSKMSGRRRFTTAQLQMLEVQWSISQSPNKAERQRIAMWMGTRTKHVNIWFQNRRQHDKKLQTFGETFDSTCLTVEGLVPPTPAMRVIVLKITSGELSGTNCASMAAAASAQQSNRPRQSRKSTKQQVVHREPKANLADDCPTRLCPPKTQKILHPPPMTDKRKYEVEDYEPIRSVKYRQLEGRHMTPPLPQLQYNYKQLSRPQTTANDFDVETTYAHTQTFQHSKPFARSVKFDIPTTVYNSLHGYSLGFCPKERTALFDQVCTPSSLSSSTSDSDWSIDNAPRPCTDENMVGAENVFLKMEALPPIQVSQDIRHGIPQTYQQALKDGSWEAREVLDAADILMGMQTRR
nr:hypothetical protein L204_01954 [Cryptococcus depauperatus CBS 7855]